MTVLIYIGIITSIVCLVLFLACLYRLRNTTTIAIINSVNNTSTIGKIVLNISYNINSNKVSSNITTSNKYIWSVNQNINIYINPTDLSQPKYISDTVYLVFYILSFISFIVLISCGFALNTQNKIKNTMAFSRPVTIPPYNMAQFSQ